MIVSPYNYNVYCIRKLENNIIEKVGLNKTGININRLLAEYCKIKKIKKLEYEIILLKTHFETSDEAYETKEYFIKGFKIIEKLK